MTDPAWEVAERDDWPGRPHEPRYRLRHTASGLYAPWGAETVTREALEEARDAIVPPDWIPSLPAYMDPVYDRLVRAVSRHPAERRHRLLREIADLEADLAAAKMDLADAQSEVARIEDDLDTMRCVLAEES